MAPLVLIRGGHQDQRTLSHDVTMVMVLEMLYVCFDGGKMGDWEGGVDGQHAPHASLPNGAHITMFFHILDKNNWRRGCV